MGPLAQLRAAQTPDAATSLGLRPHLAATLVEGSEGAVLSSRAGRLALAAEERPVVERLLAGERLSVGEIGADLSRRLLLAAVAVPV